MNLKTLLLTLMLSISIVNTAYAFSCDTFNHPHSCAREWCKSGCIGATEKYVTQDGTVHPELMVNTSGKCRQACDTKYPVAEDWDNFMLEIKDGVISVPLPGYEKEEIPQLTPVNNDFSYIF